MSAPLPHLFSKQQQASFFREFEKNPCRHQKVLVSNLGLTVFVKHLVKLVKLVEQVLQSALREKKKKTTAKRQRPQGLLCFYPLLQQKPSNTLSFHKKHICLIGYIGGQNSTSSGVPIHTSAGVLPLAMQASLVTLIELF
jgi:hypothetical protein